MQSWKIIAVAVTAVILGTVTTATALAYYNGQPSYGTPYRNPSANYGSQPRGMGMMGGGMRGMMGGGYQPYSNYPTSSGYTPQNTYPQQTDQRAVEFRQLGMGMPRAMGQPTQFLLQRDLDNINNN